MIQNSPRQQLEARWIKIVTVFLWITLLWSIVEGAVSTYFGYIQNDLSLFAFGVDSWIEVFSASLVLYHMMCKSLPTLRAQQTQSNAATPLQNPVHTGHGSALFSLETERKLTLLIGFLLIMFCLFACAGGGYRLYNSSTPDSSMGFEVGMFIGGVCVVAMFIMYYYKTKAAVILNSATLSSDAACSFGCVKLSFVLLLGSFCYYMWEKLWWVDSATAILIGLLVGYEGYETVKAAKDKETFKGGCGCCGASNSGLAKYFKNKIQKEYGYDSMEDSVEANPSKGISHSDHCCDSNHSHHEHAHHHDHDCTA